MKKKKNQGKKHLKPNYQKKLNYYQASMRKWPTLSEDRFMQVLCDYYGVEHKERYSAQERKLLPFVFQRQFRFEKKGKAFIVDFYIK
jgi:hypothetical protein